ALAEFVPMFQPASNVNILAHMYGGGRLTGSHRYIVVAVDGPAGAHYSQFAYSQAITLDRPGTALITWTPSPSNPPGYLVVRDVAHSAFYVAGGASNRFVDTGTNPGCCWANPDTPSLIAKPLMTQ